MSLTQKQVEDTIREFELNLKMTELSLNQIADDLNTSVDSIKQTLHLQTHVIEDPWILKNYLVEHIEALGKKPISFSALSGDYRRYWFLNSKIIGEKKISNVSSN
ncbi:DUF2316 family protein [Gottfriedia sp. NPDC056225]|uniref:DUF2316 family protein n=1 Tax=Gottfriedia sp. NPDC056225 TaxID=3345751 RepID=UPI001558FE69|nr:DUF2316 family protein [Arthrobacter citreus]